MRLSCFFAINFVWVLASADVFPFRNSTEYQNGVMGEYPAQAFVSDPDVLAPVANIIVEAQDGVSPEKYTTWAATGPNIPEQGPQLLAVDTLSVVYQAPLFGLENFGLTVQTCNGTDYLIWWSGQRFENRAAGTWHIVGTSDPLYPRHLTNTISSSTTDTKAYGTSARSIMPSQTPMTYSLHPSVQQ